MPWTLRLRLFLLFTVLVEFAEEVVEGFQSEEYQDGAGSGQHVHAAAAGQTDSIDNAKNNINEWQKLADQKRRTGWSPDKKDKDKNEKKD